MKGFLLTAAALVCFALNSILCRLALRSGEIDPPTFTAVRLIAGALMLTLLVFAFAEDRGKNDDEKIGQSNWLSAFLLFVYAFPFSLAYLNLTAATGALILFGTVQLTMIAVALWKGERPRFVEWIGLLCAFGGLLYLVFPGLSAPPLLSSALMMTAGIAWGFYTLRGKSSRAPLVDTKRNFVRAVPFILLAVMPFISEMHGTPKGFLLAILSGAIASGAGYAIWYSALRFHTATRAALFQLSVPAIAAFGGILLLGEALSAQLVIASVAILGGIALSIAGKSSPVKK